MKQTLSFKTAIALLSLFLSGAITLQAKVKPKAKHVVMIGIDGWAAKSMATANMPTVKDMLMKNGSWTQQVTDACQKHGGFYLGSIGGPAAVLAQNNIKSIECVEYPELGMEAIWKITVEDFPAFILVDDKGNDFFKQLKPLCCKA